MRSATFANLPPKFKAACFTQNINKVNSYSFFENENQTISYGITMGKSLSRELDIENASSAAKSSNSVQDSFNNDRPRCIPGAVFLLR